MQNMHVKDFRRIDNRFHKRVQSGQEKCFNLLRPLAGHAHRASQSQDIAQIRFGGAWLPPPLHAPNMSADDLDDVALQLSAPLVQDWVEKCRQVNPDIRRGDTCPLPLILPVENLELYKTLGVYKTDALDLKDFRLAFEVPLRVDIFEKPAWSRRKLPVVKHLEEVWEVMQWRKTRQARMFEPHSPLRPDLAFLAKLRYTDLVEQLSPDLKAWPMSPLLTSFVQQADLQNVGREALILACLLETEAATFPRDRGCRVGHIKSPIFGRRPRGPIFCRPP
jgi:hypothetical protein